MSQTPPWNAPRDANPNQDPHQAAYDHWASSTQPASAQHQTHYQANHWPQTQVTQGKSRTPLWITIGVVSFLLVVTLVVGGVFVFKSIFADTLATDFDDGEVVAEEPSEDPAADDYNTNWTVEDLIAATCPTGSFFDSSTGFLPGGATLGTCTGSMVSSSSVIEYGSYATEFQAENDVARALNGNLMNAYVIEPLSGGDYLAIVAYNSSDLAPLTDEFGVEVKTN